MKIIKKGYREVKEKCSNCSSILFVNMADTKSERFSANSWPYNSGYYYSFMCPVCGESNYVSSDKIKREYQKTRVRIRNK